MHSLDSLHGTEADSVGYLVTPVGDTAGIHGDSGIPWTEVNLDHGEPACLMLPVSPPE